MWLPQVQWHSGNLGILTDGNNVVSYYWLASPSANTKNSSISVRYDGIVCSYFDSSTYGGVRPVVCLGSGITVNAPVRAAAIQIHPVFRGQYSLCFHEMHDVSPLPRRGVRS